MYYAECFAIDACGFETDPRGKRAVMKAWRIMRTNVDGENWPTIVATMSLCGTEGDRAEMAKFVAEALNYHAED